MPYIISCKPDRNETYWKDSLESMRSSLRALVLVANFKLENIEVYRKRTSFTPINRDYLRFLIEDDLELVNDLQIGDIFLNFKGVEHELIASDPSEAIREDGQEIVFLENKFVKLKETK